MFEAGKGLEEVIVAEGLTKTFNGFKAVDKVTFKVYRGEIFGFLGPNGAGKTTTINLLTTLMKPSEGRGWVAGFSILSEPEKVRRKIGVLFQDITLDTELTGWENLWFHGLIYGVPRKELKQRIREMLAFVELEEWADRQVKKFSGGMRRRLQIAAALLHRPEILFLDEPTLGLDPQTRRRIWDYIFQLQKEGITVFLTTHYMEEAERLCNRVAVIDRGKIIAMGRVDELKGTVGENIHIRLASKSPEDAEKFMEALKSGGLAGEVYLLQTGEITLSTRNASEVLPKIFEEASKLNLKILEASYHAPTLEDVFLRLTGRRLRDSEVGGIESIRLAHRRR
ncbi:ABC transporter ATP-binding protein [Candidatus Bathyarchaeota archaeon]|nr:MAG: ABC transporter ATP-binding protein [Candidatus Bathyarchaeota archaeon]